MKKTLPKKKKVAEEVVVPDETLSEKEQLLSRQAELQAHLSWMYTNKLQDVGQVEVALSAVNLQLTQLV